MLIALYWIMASLIRKDAKALIKSLILLIITAGVYSFMYYKAINFISDSYYYSVNNWAENLVLLMVITEGTGVALWVYTIYNAFFKK
jgi:uncharacterized membrane protein|nr:MAG TPA: protein of unknown function (DUF4234) [Caudoviricetes sp.]